MMTLKNRKGELNNIRYLIVSFCIFLTSGCVAYQNIAITPPMDKIFEERTYSEQFGNINKYTPWNRGQVGTKNDLRTKDINEYKNSALNRVDNYLEAHSNINENIKTSLLNLRVAEGMNKEEVSLLLDHKIRLIRTNKYNADELWVFQPVYWIQEYWYLYFKGEILIRLDRKYIIQPC